MSKFFGKAFLKLLKKAYQNKEIVFKGSIFELSQQQNFEKFIQILVKKSWNVYAKTPFNGAKGGLEYLARYVSKTAISNERIISCENQKVTFKWRDYANNNISKLMTLDAHEFMRRYLTHVLPDGFMRIRTFGFLANACKTKNIHYILTLLKHHKKEDNKAPVTKETISDLMIRIANVNINQCKHCKIGTLEIIKMLPAIKQMNAYLDTS